MHPLDQDEVPVGDPALELDGDPIGNRMRMVGCHVVPDLHVGDAERRGVQPPFADECAIPANRWCDRNARTLEVVSSGMAVSIVLNSIRSVHQAAMIDYLMASRQAMT